MNRTTLHAEHGRRADAQRCRDAEMQRCRDAEMEKGFRYACTPARTPADTDADAQSRIIAMQVHSRVEQCSCTTTTTTACRMPHAARAPAVGCICMQVYGYMHVHGLVRYTRACTCEGACACQCAFAPFMRYPVQHERGHMRERKVHLSAYAREKGTSAYACTSLPSSRCACRCVHVDVCMLIWMCIGKLPYM
jgi:hypothetical protein